MLNKKSIGAVIATILLLFVAVLTIFSLKGWLMDTQSKFSSDIESRVSRDSVEISSLEQDIIYIRNDNKRNITVENVKISGIDCNVSGSIGKTGIYGLNLSNCLAAEENGIKEVVVFTKEGIFSRNVYLKSISTPLNCSALGLAGGEWVSVPGNAVLGTTDFCVMKFEAKFVNYTGKIDGYHNIYYSIFGDNNITSSIIGGPASFNQTDAEIACQNLGTNYHLISDSEWVTIVRNAESLASNWNTSVVYSGSMMRGHSDGTPFQALNVTNVNDGYDQTGQSWPSIERRTLNLENGGVIWDIGGNVPEWTSDTLNTSGVLNSSLGMGTGEAMVEWNTIPSSYDFLKATNTSLTSANGIGQVYYDGNTAFPSGNTHAFLRGGDFYSNISSGAFSLILSLPPEGSFFISFYGFRCVYNP